MAIEAPSAKLACKNSENIGLLQINKHTFQLFIA